VQRDLPQWGLGLAALIAAGCSGPAATASCPESPFRSEPPLVIAHAGGEGLGPSNTLLAMRRSLDAGADVLDVDVWMTADGVVVARHDRDLATSTDGQGNVDDTTWAELQQLDTRAKWSGAAIERPERVPSLDMVLREFPDVRLSVEIKQTTPPMSAQLCDVLVATDAVDRVYLSANDDEAVYAAQAECPSSTIITTTYRDVDAMREARAKNLDWCAPAPIGQPPYRQGSFSPEDVKWSHDHGMAIYTWTVDDPDTLRALALAGVDGVYTRRPDVARAVFDSLSDG
jgi:glycerophosphoryl diester phosphodiesterase